MSRTDQRLVGVAGIAFVVLTLIALFAVPGPPAAGAAAKDVAQYYTDHRGALLPLGWVGLLGLVGSFFFIGGLIAIFKRAEGEAGWLWLVVLGSGAASGATAMILGVVGAVLPFSAAGSGSALAKVLSDTLGLGFAAYLLPAGSFFAAAGWLIIRHAPLPAWLGYAAFLVAVLALLGSLGLFVESGPLQAGGLGTFVAFLFQAAWWLAASITLLTRPQPA